MFECLNVWMLVTLNAFITDCSHCISNDCYKTSFNVPQTLHWQSHVSYFVIFSNFFKLVLWSPGILCRWFCSLLSLCQLSKLSSMCLFCKILQRFRISRFATPVLDDKSTTFYDILFQISWTEAGERFYFIARRSVFYTDFLLTEIKNKQYVWYYHLSLSIASIGWGKNI